MRPYIEKQSSEFQPITAKKLIESVKNTFRGDPPVPSSKREEMLNLAAFSAAHTSLEKLLPLGEPVVKSQIAVITPPQIEQFFKQSDELIQAGQLSQEAVSAALEIAQAGILTADEAATSDTTLLAEKSGKEFLFPISREWRNLVGVFIALLFVLSMVTTACAADNSASPEAAQLTGQPTFIVDTPQPPLDGTEGETPAPTEEAPRQICVFDSARNVRTGPSATAGKTTLDGANTTVAGKEYECLKVVENPDKSVWILLREASEDDQQPEAWAVLEHPALKLTGSITAKEPDEAASIEAQTPITDTTTAEAVTLFDLETQKALIEEYNSIAPDLGLGAADTVIQAIDGSILYIKNGKPVATSRQIKNEAGTVTATQLFAIDAAGTVAETVIAEDLGTGWEGVDGAAPATPDAPAAPAESDAAIDTSTALTETETIGTTTTSIEASAITSITEALQPQSPEQVAMNDLLPANFAEKLQEKGITSITFDTASSLYHVVDKDGQEFYFVPQAAPSAEGDGSADFDNGFFMGTEESWMHLKAGKVTLDMLFLVDLADKVLDGPLNLVDELNGGGDPALSEAVIRALGMDPEVEKAITVVLAQSSIELTIFEPPAQREGQLPKVFESNDSRQRVFVVGPNKYVSVGYMLRTREIKEETYINLLKNYVAQGAPDEYFVNAIWMTRYISRHISLLFDTLSGRSRPILPEDLLNTLRTLVRDGQEGYKAAATAPLKDDLSWIK